MPIIIPSQHVQATFNWSGPAFASGGGATVLGFDFNDSVNFVNMNQFAETLRDAWDSNLRSNTSDSVVLDDVTVVTDVLTATLVAGIAGGNTGATPAPNTCILQNYGTDFRGRRARGRSYWPGHVYEAEMDNQGNLDTSYLADIQGLFDGFWADVEAFSVQLQQVILQGDNSGDVTPPLSPPPTVQSRQISGKVATQRRRLRP